METGRFTTGAKRSGSAEKARLLQQFDLCYFDGGHTWDATGFGFLLVDLLLRPGGWAIFDDLEWTIERAIPEMTRVPPHWLECSADKQSTPAVKMVFDVLAPHLGYTDRESVNNDQWGIARKPCAEERPVATESRWRKLSGLLGAR